MPYFMTVLIAQAVNASDPLSGASGWVGSGLLGAVLGWLLFVHLPGKDKQIFGLIESRDKLVTDLTERFRESISEIMVKADTRDKERSEEYKYSLQVVVNHCEKEVQGMVNSFKKEFEGLRRPNIKRSGGATEEKKGDRL